MSVLIQRGIRVQLIVMDGGSSDQTVDILKKYSKSIQYKSEPDNGQAHALNKALVLAEAPIVGWLNSDDKYLPGAFSRILKVFSCHHDTALVHGQRVLVNEKSDVIGWSRSGPFNKQTRRFNINSETAFWRRDCIKDHHFKEELKFAMDTHFFCTIASQLKTHYIPRFIGCFRCHPDSKSSNLWLQYAVPESTQVWMELFGEPIDHSGVKSKDSSVFNKLVDFSSLPLSISSAYGLYRLKKLISSLNRNVHGK